MSNHFIRATRAVHIGIYSSIKKILASGILTWVNSEKKKTNLTSMKETIIDIAIRNFYTP